MIGIQIRTDISDWLRFKNKFRVAMSAQMMIAMHKSLNSVGFHATKDMPYRGSIDVPRIPSPVPNIITGRLKSSVFGMNRPGAGGDAIRSITNVGTGLLGEIGSNVPYAPYMEKRFPFLNPGLKKAIPDIYAHFKLHLEIAIREADYV